MTQLRHFDDLGTVRFLTFSCFNRHPYLVTPFARHTIIEGLKHLRVRRCLRILAWVMMPEHLHLIVLPPPGMKLGHEIGKFKRWTARQIIDQDRDQTAILRRANGDNALWHRRCYDHNCRWASTVLEKISYCHKNPVTRGLVVHPSQWIWSSYNWYSREGKIVLEIDGIDL